MLGVGALLALGVITSPGGCGADELRFPTIPAHWVDSADGFEPLRGGDFMFDAVSFSSPSEGWIVGNRYILHIEGAALQLQFLRSADIDLNDVQDSESAGTIAGGANRCCTNSTRGILLRRVGGGWREEGLESNGLEDWFITDVHVNAAAGWAFGLEERAQEVRSVLWQRGEGDWRLNPARETRPGFLWSFARMCLEPSGEGWFVGSEWTEDRQQQRALVVRWRAGKFEKVPLPDLPGPSSYVNHVACFADGKALAAAVVGVSGYRLNETGAVGILLAYDGAWHPVELPPRLHGYRATAVAPVSPDDVWLVLWAPHDPLMFVHWHDQCWDEVPPPVLPDGRRTGYSVSDMQFVTPSEGWAVANDYGGPGIVRGLIFHYRDGVWRNRNWNWHFWHQRWFGLFGD